MHWRIIFSILSLSLALAFTSCEALGGGSEEEAAIRKKADSYAKAFNRQDPKALANLWAEDAEYVNPRTGETLEGRNEIEEAFQATFKEKNNAKIEIKISSITFPKRNQAVETGTVIVTSSNEEPNQTAYKATYENRNGDWLLTNVREVDLIEPVTNFDQLKDLEWLIGDWVDEDEDVRIVTHTQWDKYKNFITQKFSIFTEGTLELEGRQLITWDPIKGQIRSWVFDSDGGFGEASWRKEGKNWIVEAAHTLTDGRRASAVNIYTPVNQNSYTWESTGREVGGELLPNVDPVTVVRKKD